MKENELNHDLTPPALRDINQRLVALLASEDDETRFQKLNNLIDERNNLIQQHLASLDPEQSRNFAQLEIPVNNNLRQLAQALLSSAKKDMSHFVRSQSAIKKYK